MPIVTPIVDLKDSFPYTNLDLEDSGPINVSNYNHQQNFTPSDKFTNSTEGSGGKLENIGFDGPGQLDLENNGPRNASNYNHQQQWTPTSEYTDDALGQRQGGLLQLNGFDGPEGLDLENNGPINSSQYGHQQNFTPSDKFIDSTEGSKTGGKLKDVGFDGPEDLDIETNPKTVFPKTGKQQFGFTQQWGPGGNEYRNTDLGEEGSGLYNENNSLQGNLDLQNNDPTNVAQYNHQQVYTPSSTYETYINEKGFEDSNLVQNSFNKKYNGRGYGGDFDIENNEPNRSNPLGAKSSNIIKSTRNGRTILEQIQHPYTQATPYFQIGTPLGSTGGDDLNVPTGAGNQGPL